MRVNKLKHKIAGGIYSMRFFCVCKQIYLDLLLVLLQYARSSLCEFLIFFNNYIWPGTQRELTLYSRALSVKNGKQTLKIHGIC